MTYKQAFPDFPDEDIPPEFLTAPWTDCSWRNDTCPSFSRPCNGKEVHVYVDYAEPSQRDVWISGKVQKPCPRFTVTMTDDDGQYPVDDAERYFFHSDSLVAVLDHVGFMCGEVAR